VNDGFCRWRALVQFGCNWEKKVLLACWLQAARHLYSRKSGPDRDVHEVVFKHQSIAANLQAALSE
jgi:hypothetical protein